MNQVKAVRFEAGGRMGIDVIIFVTYWNTHTFTKVCAQLKKGTI